MVAAVSQAHAGEEALGGNCTRLVASQSDPSRLQRHRGPLEVLARVTVHLGMDIRLYSVAAYPRDSGSTRCHFPVPIYANLLLCYSYPTCSFHT
jgi:hypothetical protein